MMVCMHPSSCEVCGPADVMIHEAAAAVRSWAEGIAELARLAREEGPEGQREALFSAIEGLAWAIDRRAELDIEGETLANWSSGGRSLSAVPPAPPPPG